jgi:hypothetical protein
LPSPGCRARPVELQTDRFLRGKDGADALAEKRPFGGVHGKIISGKIIVGNAFGV